MKKAKIKIYPEPHEVLIKTEDVAVGILDTQSIKSAVEVGLVIAIGKKVPEVSNVKIGDKILYKAWAVDTSTMDGLPYRFINVETGGIKAVIE